MEINRVIELLKIEQKCVRRQNSEECPRNRNSEYGCYGCDLVQEDKDILEAYDTAIEYLKVMDDWCAILGEFLVNCGFSTVDQIKAFLKEMEGDQNG